MNVCDLGRDRGNLGCLPRFCRCSTIVIFYDRSGHKLVICWYCWSSLQVCIVSVYIHIRLYIYTQRYRTYRSAARTRTAAVYATRLLVRVSIFDLTSPKIIHNTIHNTIQYVLYIIHGGSLCIVQPCQAVPASQRR